MDDDIFKAYCYEHFDVNKDGIVAPYEVIRVDSLMLNGKGIKSLKGIETITLGCRIPEFFYPASATVK